MIQVFDNIVDIFDQEIIKNNLFKEKDWEFIEDVSAKDNKHQQRPGFKIHFKTIIPSINDILLKTAKKIKLKDPKLLEVRSFLQLPLDKDFIGEGVDTPHIDLYEPHWVFLYYVIDSDGDTIIYDYKSKNKDDIPYFEDIKEIKRITPKQGRVVVFDGAHWHTAEQPRKNKRCIINFNVNK